MNFRRKLRSVFAIVLVASLAVPVLLYPPRISSQEISVDRYAYTETTTVENNIDHQAFSIEPIHLFVFIFRGNNPSQYRTIDTSNCL